MITSKLPKSGKDNYIDVTAQLFNVATSVSNCRLYVYGVPSETISLWSISINTIVTYVGKNGSTSVTNPYGVLKVKKDTTLSISYNASAYLHFTDPNLGFRRFEINFYQIGSDTIYDIWYTSSPVSRTYTHSSSSYTISSPKTITMDKAYPTFSGCDSFQCCNTYTYNNKVLGYGGVTMVQQTGAMWDLSVGCSISTIVS